VLSVLGTTALPSPTMMWVLLLAMQDLGYLLPERYDHDWKAKLAAALLLRHVRDTDSAKGAARLQYNSQVEYDGIAAYLMMIREWKVGRFCEISYGSGRHRQPSCWEEFWMLQQCARLLDRMIEARTRKLHETATCEPKSRTPCEHTPRPICGTDGTRA